MMRPILTLSAWRRPASAALRRLEAVILPPRCAFCGTRSYPGEGRICDGCRGDLPWIANACGRCAAPVAVTLPRDVPCAGCQKRPFPFHSCIAPLHYRFPVDAGLKALKFRRSLHYAPAFGELLVAELPRLPEDVDALLPVPLHWRRQAARGFNQATELSAALARQAKLPILTGVARRRATAFQSGLNAGQRRQNMANAFVVRKVPTHRHVLLVDDVITTGETTRQLAAALIGCGVQSVSVVAVARAA